MAKRLYRVQDIEGRGPYRPGFSQYWADDDGPDNPPWWIEMGCSLDHAIRMADKSMFGGCAFETIDHLKRWFTRAEIEKLDAFGYFVVKFRPDRVIAKTPRQVVFEQSYPLSGLPLFCRLADCL